MVWISAQFSTQLTFTILAHSQQTVLLCHYIYGMLSTSGYTWPTFGHKPYTVNTASVWCSNVNQALGNINTFSVWCEMLLWLAVKAFCWFWQTSSGCQFPYTAEMNTLNLSVICILLSFVVFLSCLSLLSLSKHSRRTSGEERLRRNRDEHGQQKRRLSAKSRSDSKRRGGCLKSMQVNAVQTTLPCSSSVFWRPLHAVVYWIILRSHSIRPLRL